LLPTQQRIARAHRLGRVSIQRTGDGSRDWNGEYKNKVAVPEEHWDYAWPLGSTAVIITTVDKEGRVNAAGFATCVRVSHGPIFISFTSGLRNDTHRNVLDTGVPGFSTQASTARPSTAYWYDQSKRQA
jgi:hypothetical protein